VPSERRLHRLGRHAGACGERPAHEVAVEACLVLVDRDAFAGLSAQRSARLRGAGLEGELAGDLRELLVARSIAELEQRGAGLRLFVHHEMAQAQHAERFRIVRVTRRHVVAGGCRHARQDGLCGVELDDEVAQGVGQVRHVLRVELVAHRRQVGVGHRLAACCDHGVGDLCTDVRSEQPPHRVAVSGAVEQRGFADRNEVAHRLLEIGGAHRCAVHGGGHVAGRAPSEHEQRSRKSGGENAAGHRFTLVVGENERQHANEKLDGTLVAGYVDAQHLGLVVVRASRDRLGAALRFFVESRRRQAHRRVGDYHP